MTPSTSQSNNMSTANPSSQSSSSKFKSQRNRNTSSGSGLSSSAANLSSLSAVAGAEGREFVQLNATGLKWTDDGKRLVVMGKDRFCSCDITFKEDGDGDGDGEGSVDINIVDEEGDLNELLA